MPVPHSTLAGPSIRPSLRRKWKGKAVHPGQGFRQNLWEEFAMPIHDWKRGDDFLFHNLHLGWVVELCGHLNQGVLPSSYFAMSETIDYRPPPEFLDLGEPEQPFVDPGRPGDIRFV